MLPIIITVSTETDLVLFSAQNFKQPIKLQFVDNSFAIQYIGRNNIRNFM